MLKIATWNVNSLRVRLSQVVEWLQQQNPDILALQETKLTDDVFPQTAFTELGYHVVFTGQKTYNGVATLSRLPAHTTLTTLPHFADEQRRFLETRYSFENKELVVINVYVPNGAELGCEKYQYKLLWLQSLHRYLTELAQQTENIIILGDFNIAPTDADVFNPTDWENSILTSDPERHELQNLCSLGLFDSFRLFEQPEHKFSWWNYQAGSFRRNDGARIDLILVSNSLKSLAKNCYIDLAPRRLPRPSDHTPVVLELQTS